MIKHFPSPGQHELGQACLNKTHELTSPVVPCQPQNYLHRYVCKLHESLAEEEKLRRPGGDRGVAGGQAGGPSQQYQPAVRTQHNLIH